MSQKIIKKSPNRNRRNRRPHVARRMFAERLEDRRLMTADLGGNTLTTATNLGSQDGARVISDFVGIADPNDYYRIQIDRQSEVRIGLDGLRADADLQLLDASGRYVAGSFNGGMNPEAVDRVIESGDYFVLVYPYGNANTNYRLSLETTTVQQGLDVSAVSPIADYDGHLGADYMANAGTAVLSPVSGRVIDVRAVDGYGTMAVAIEVTLPSARTFISEQQGGTITTNRVVLAFGHLRPSRDLIAHPDANYRFQQGRNELTYSVGSYVTAGQLLGYVETHGYEGPGSTGSHVHVTESDANNPPANIWQGRGVPDNDPRRARYIRPELAWSLLR
jgi:hypothetical protein